jgi:hypothetical protein
MYVICMRDRCIIIAPEFTLRVGRNHYALMMIERKNDGYFHGLVTPVSNIRLRYIYYNCITPMNNCLIYSSSMYDIRYLVEDYRTWTIPDFAKQCEIMDVLCDHMY